MSEARCQVSLGGDRRSPCGLPVAARGLCAQHLAERVRLGGTP